MTDDELRVERRIRARPDAVYRYLTDSVLWSRWQGTSSEIEAVPDGLFRMSIADGSTAEGRFVQLEPDRRIVFTWGWRGHPSVPPGSTTVEIELTADGEGTLVRLVHRGLPPRDRPIHRAGWDRYLPRLALAAEGGDPGLDRPPG